MIKEGTLIPENLVLLHEFKDHYSMQTSVACTEKEINQRLTKFLKENAELVAREKLLKMIKDANIN